MEVSVLLIVLIFPVTKGKVTGTFRTVRHHSTHPGQACIVLAAAAKVGPDVPRLLVNREVVGQRMGAGGLDFAPETNRRDALHLGDCDDGACAMAALLGWQKELSCLVVEAGGSGRDRGGGGSGRTGCLNGLFGGS